MGVAPAGASTVPVGVTPTPAAAPVPGVAPVPVAPPPVPHTAILNPQAAPVVRTLDDRLTDSARVSGYTTWALMVANNWTEDMAINAGFLAPA